MAPCKPALIHVALVELLKAQWRQLLRWQHQAQVVGFPVHHWPSAEPRQHNEHHLLLLLLLLLLLQRQRQPSLL
jgi:hypothetical protein